MKNTTGKKLEKLVFGMFDQMIEGADKYVTKQGSTWLIFTEDKRWAIEFTKDKTLWFNYNLFQGELDLIGKDCTEERDLIKNWFESRFLNTPKVKDIIDPFWVDPVRIKDAIQNGVKQTKCGLPNQRIRVERAIQNEVKHTVPDASTIGYAVEDTIQNGVKHTHRRLHQFPDNAEDTIQNGVKNTEWYSGNSYGEVEDTIENGVKETKSMCGKRGVRVDYTIQNGVKDTRSYSDRDKKTVGDIIQSGVKEVMTDDGMIKRIGRRIRAINAIESGVKHVEDGDWLDQDERIGDIIENGVKEIREVTFLNQMFVEETIQDGVKEIGVISNISLMSEIFKVNANRAIRDGVKEVIEENHHRRREVVNVIKNI